MQIFYIKLIFTNISAINYGFIDLYNSIILIGIFLIKYGSTNFIML